MITFTEPDCTIYPSNFTSKNCPGLEALTGADMVLSQIPIPPTVNLDLHIKNRSLFVQIKIGYDIISFDQLHSSIARMQKCGIPKGQAILLPIGEYWQDGLSNLRIKGKKPFGNIPYSTLETIFDMWDMRGGIVEPSPPKHIDDLQGWIDRKQHAFDKIAKEGKKDVYPPRPEFIPEDIWQSVEEITDWRKFLVSGLDKFGSAKANAVFKYAREYFDGSPFGFYHILCLMTDEKDGKPVHKIPLWGDKSRQDFREQLGIQDHWNLSEVVLTSSCI